VDVVEEDGMPKLREMHDQVWDLYEQGLSAAKIALVVSKAAPSVAEYIRNDGGIRPNRRCRAARQLTAAEREDISRGLAAGASLRTIASGLGRSASTVSREVQRNGGRDAYRAADAETAAWERAKRPKTCKLHHPMLRKRVQEKLDERWSPEQIAGWLARSYPDSPELQVSHETIYRSLYIQSRGALRKDLTSKLRTRRTLRIPKTRSHRRGQGRGKLVDIVHVSQRPAEAQDRAVPGHWEGDLLLGKGMSGIATLVERTSRFVMLVELEGIKSEQVLAALAEHIFTLPEQLRRSLTWDQGMEMARHAQFTIDTGLQIYICDPKSPWQRGSNENTNGLLRQYFPKRVADFRTITQADLDAVAAELNGRPRKTLDFMTPSEKFTEAVAATR
jgi:IS30 family transposase